MHSPTNTPYDIVDEERLTMDELCDWWACLPPDSGRVPPNRFSATASPAFVATPVRFASQPPAFIAFPAAEAPRPRAVVPSCAVVAVPVASYPAASTATPIM